MVIIRINIPLDVLSGTMRSVSSVASLVVDSEVVSIITAVVILSAHVSFFSVVHDFIRSVVGHGWGLSIFVPIFQFVEFPVFPVNQFIAASFLVLGKG